MGSFHARVLADLGYDVTTVDPDPEREAGFLSLAGRSGVPVASRFDAVCVATPIPLLIRTAAEVAVRFRVDRMLIEKPMLPSSQEWARWAPALAHVPSVAVGYVERFNPVVRKLIRECQGEKVECIEFTRLNDRPTPDARLDLWSHDVDLAVHLASSGVDFDNVRYVVDGGQPSRERSIKVTTSTGATTYDLTDHATSPLHAQWHAFLSGTGTRPATPKDALAVLRTIEATATLRRAA